MNVADEEVTDPGLLRKHSELRSFKTSRFEYSSLRIFFQRRMSIFSILQSLWILKNALALSAS